jgi:hypothetical protein
MRTHSSSLESFAASPAGSWFETRENALLNMRVQDLILRSIAKRCVSKDDHELEIVLDTKPIFFRAAAGSAG